MKRPAEHPAYNGLLSITVFPTGHRRNTASIVANEAGFELLAVELGKECIEQRVAFKTLKLAPHGSYIKRVALGY